MSFNSFGSNLGANQFQQVNQQQQQPTNIFSSNQKPNNIFSTQPNNTINQGFQQSTTSSNPFVNRPFSNNGASGSSFQNSNNIGGQQQGTVQNSQFQTNIFNNSKPQGTVFSNNFNQTSNFQSGNNLNQQSTMFSNQGGNMMTNNTNPTVMTNQNNIPTQANSPIVNVLPGNFQTQQNVSNQSNNPNNNIFLYTNNYQSINSQPHQQQPRQQQLILNQHPQGQPQGFPQQSQQNSQYFSNPQQALSPYGISLPIPQTQQTKRQKTIQQIENYVRSLDKKFRYFISNSQIDYSNNYQHISLHRLTEIKPQIQKIIKNFQTLREYLKQLNSQQNQLEKKNENYLNSVRKKLTLYKQCLIQSLQQNSMVEQIDKQLILINVQLENVLKPLFNSYLQQKFTSVSDPDEFCLSIAQDIYMRIQILSEKVDDIIICRTGSKEQLDTLTVCEGLIEYYHNVSLAFKQFIQNYKIQSKKALQKKYPSNVTRIIREIQEKKVVPRAFQLYEKVKEIDNFLQQHQRQ